MDSFFSPDRGLSKKKLETLSRRANRIARLSDPIANSTQILHDLSADGTRRNAILVRSGYLYRATAPQTPSDRNAPPLHERPPMTQLITPRGAALRLHLLSLAVAQLNTTHGHPHNPLPLKPPTGGGPCWTGLLASPTQYTGDGSVAVGGTDKRLRQINNALDSLRAARLVYYPEENAAVTRKRHGFRLLDETVSTAPSEEPGRYTVPKRTEDCLHIPLTFFTNGWVHTLEDTEIAVLFMVMLGKSRLPEGNDLVAIPAKDRLGHYGISYDSFSDARRFLRSCGLLEVLEVNRHHDGRAEDYAEKGALLHRMKYLPGGLDQDATLVLPDRIARFMSEQHKRT